MMHFKAFGTPYHHQFVAASRSLLSDVTFSVCLYHTPPRPSHKCAKILTGSCRYINHLLTYSFNTHIHTNIGKVYSFHSDVIVAL